MGQQEVHVQVFVRTFPPHAFGHTDRGFPCNRFEWHSVGKCVSAGLENIVELIRDLDTTIKSDIIISSPDVPGRTTSHSHLFRIFGKDAEELAKQIQRLEKNGAIRKNKFQFKEGFLKH